MTTWSVPAALYLANVFAQATDVQCVAAELAVICVTNEIDVAVDRKDSPKARSFFERGPQEKGGEPAGLVTPLGQ